MTLSRIHLPIIYLYIICSIQISSVDDNNKDLRLKYSVYINMIWIDMIYVVKFYNFLNLIEELKLQIYYVLFYPILNINTDQT